MKFVFFKIIVSVTLVLGPVKAITKVTQEEANLSQARLVLNGTALRESIQEDRPSMPTMLYKEDVSVEILPYECLMSVFSSLDLIDLGRVAQVSTFWARVSDETGLWRFMGSRNYGDYLSTEDLVENPKQKVIYHYLSVIVNTTENSEKIESLVRHFKLDLYVPSFKRYIPSKFLVYLVTDLSDRKNLIVQGDLEAIEREKHVLLVGGDGYEDPSEARAFNELLIRKGDSKAIERKIEALANGDKNLSGSSYGYKKDPSAAREFIESLLMSENPIARAIGKYIRAFAQKYGVSELGYERDHDKAIEFIKKNHVPY